MLQREVEVWNAGLENRLDESARQPRRVEVQQADPLYLTAQGPGEVDERLRASLVEHLDRLAAARAATVVAPAREVLGDQHQLLDATFGERAGLTEDLLGGA